SQSITYSFFLFSSRRRHTRSKRDWSSDVCSSDLAVVLDVDALEHRRAGAAGADRGEFVLGDLQGLRHLGLRVLQDARDVVAHGEIGRASCRKGCRGGRWADDDESNRVMDMRSLGR